MTTLKEVKEGLYSYQEPSKGWVISIRSAGDLIKAAEKIKETGIKLFDCFSPFPIHGLDKAMGLKRSWIPFITLIFGLLGAISAFSFMTYVDVFAWPMNIGGKPHFAWPAYIPITFEITILFAGLSTVGAVIFLGKLGKISRKTITPSITSDGFAIWIGDDISKEKIEETLGSLAQEINSVESS